MLKSYFLRAFTVLVICLCIADSSYLMTNTFYSIRHDAFDGFVSPVSQSVDWVNLPSNLHNSYFHEVSDQYKTNVPKYDASVLAQQLQGVGFSSTEDLNIRNTKITYSVPYLGNYKLDGIQNSGSHPGVDVKLLKNTPLYSIANAVVVKSVKSNIGFGNYIVLLHKDVVDPNNPSKKTDIYSTYAHLDRILVEEGQIVTKGQMIAFSGDSGLSTTPHLDFQINTKDVPFLPYWPFNVNEISKDGYDFVSAVNQGVGYLEASKYTINPFEYIQKYKDFSWNTKVLSSELDNYRVVEIQEDQNIEIEVKNDSFDSQINTQVENENKFSVLNINYPSKYLYIENSNLNLSFSGEFDLNKIKFHSNLLDFKFQDQKSQVANFSITPLNYGSETVKIYYDGSLISEKQIDVQVFRDVSVDSEHNNILKSLNDKQVLNGFSDGSIDLYSKITKVEAIVLISRLIDPNIGLNSKSWYLDQLNLAIEKQAVDESIKLLDSINMAELLKIIYTYLDVDISFRVHDFYSELFDVNSWYAPYVQEAYRKNIISNKNLLTLDKELNRLEVFELINEFSDYIY